MYIHSLLVVLDAHRVPVLQSTAFDAGRTPAIVLFSSLDATAVLPHDIFVGSLEGSITVIVVLVESLTAPLDTVSMA
jgi:hypothetical protein